MPLITGTDADSIHVKVHDRAISAV